jgi:hypothetical protein
METRSKRRRPRRFMIVCGAAVACLALAAPAGAVPHKPTKPGAPTITGVTPGFHSVTVKFNPPASNGGSPILNYRVVCTSTNGGAPGANEGPQSPIKVSGLTTGKTYHCTVSAKNKVGRGPASAPSGAFMPTKHK